MSLGYNCSVEIVLMFRGQLVINSSDIRYVAPGGISQSVVDIVILY